jgi:hypothetical protein
MSTMVSANVSKLAWLILCSLLMHSIGYAQVKLKSAQISFYTPAHDDKDWDTKINVTLYLSDGTLIGSADYNSCDNHSTTVEASKCFCCVEPLYDGQHHLTNPNEMTMFPNGGSRGPFNLIISNFVEKQKIKTGFFRIRINPNGNDRWVFIPSVTLIFDDATKVSLSNYPATIVAQDAPQATLVFF